MLSVSAFFVLSLSALIILEVFYTINENVMTLLYISQQNKWYPQRCQIWNKIFTAVTNLTFVMMCAKIHNN